MLGLRLFSGEKSIHIKILALWLAPVLFLGIFFLYPLSSIFRYSLARSKTGFFAFSGSCWLCLLLEDSMVYDLAGSSINFFHPVDRLARSLSLCPLPIPRKNHPPGSLQHFICDAYPGGSRCI